MINITERDNYVLVSTPEKDTYLRKGMAYLDYVGGKITLRRRSGGTVSKTPILSVVRIGLFGTITDKSGNAVTDTTMDGLAEKISNFFS